eukprot:scaffold1239_cov175-Pinguiococcus_pyrenoidosus.AAC.58
MDTACAFRPPFPFTRSNRTLPHASFARAQGGVSCPSRARFFPLPVDNRERRAAQSLLATRMDTEVSHPPHGPRHAEQARKDQLPFQDLRAREAECF